MQEVKILLLIIGTIRKQPSHIRALHRTSNKPFKHLEIINLIFV